MKLKYILPLIGWLVPTVVISVIMFKVDAPLTDAQLVGFIALLASACITYIVGVKVVLKDK